MKCPNKVGLEMPDISGATITILPGKCGTGKGQPIGVNNAIAALLIFTGGLLVAGLLFLLELLAGISLRRGIGAYVQGRRKSA